MRSKITYIFDLIIFAISPFVAIAIRENFSPYLGKLEDLIPYAILGTAIAAVVFVISGVKGSVWRHTSLPDFIRIVSAVTISILLVQYIMFLTSRLDGVARSVPPIQWAFVIATMSAARLFIRLTRHRRDNLAKAAGRQNKEHVLVVGVSDVAELYLRCVAGLAKNKISVEGILEEDPKLKGRKLFQNKVLGQPSELPQLLATFNVHGIQITRVVVTVPFEQLSEQSQHTLLTWERSGTVTLDLFEERLGFKTDEERLGLSTGVDGNDSATKNLASVAQSEQKFAPEIDEVSENNGPLKSKSYCNIKRILDVAGVLILSVLLFPFIVVAGILVAIDLGFPLIFWQMRPGLHGRLFKLYKFRTMAPKHVNYGNRGSNLDIDADRMSAIGRFIRRSRLDELPQLYHILIGEMSFVGPRPLLVEYQPKNGAIRLSVKPGVTGWAQINGGDKLSADEKLALDVWYLKRQSIWLDIQILFKTLIIAIKGDQVRTEIINSAMEELRSISTISAQTMSAQQGDVVESGGKRAALSVVENVA